MTRQRLIHAILAITCLIAAACSDSDPVRVPAPRVVSLTPSVVRLERGHSTTLTATVSAPNFQLSSSAVNWSWSTDNPDVVQVDPTTGSVVAIFAGYARVTVTSYYGSATATITVTDSAYLVPAQIRINSPPIIWLGEAFDLEAEVCDIWFTPTPRTVTWSSDAPEVISVDSATGRMHALAEGTATITASSGSITSAFSIRSARPSAGRISGSTRVFPGGEVPLRAEAPTGRPGEYYRVPASWTTDDSGIVDVHAGDHLGDVSFRALRAGTARLTASFYGHTATADVTVEELGGALVYLRTDGDTRTIERARFDGLAPVTIPIPMQVNAPSASLDGKYLAFECGGNALCTSAADGSDARVLGFGLSSPSWSPDGTTMVAVQNGRTLSELDPDGRILRYVNSPWELYSPRYSGDGAQVLHGIVASSAGPDSAWLTVHHMRAGGYYMLDLTAYAWAWSVSDRIVVDGGASVNLLDPDSQEETPIFRHPVGGWGSVDLAWSPDGTRLAASVGHDLWIINADGSNPIRFITPTLPSGTISFLSWVRDPQ